MPFGDGTGPAGMGPMTGRAAGYCAGYPVPGSMNPIPGRGFWGRGRGFGRGWRHRYLATGLPGWARAGLTSGFWAYPYTAYGTAPTGQVTQEQELDALKFAADAHEKTLDEIKKRIEELQAALKAEK